MRKVKPFGSENIDLTKPAVIVLPPGHWLLTLPRESLEQLAPAPEVEILVAPPPVREDARGTKRPL